MAPLENDDTQYYPGQDPSQPQATQTAPQTPQAAPQPPQPQAPQGPTPPAYQAAPPLSNQGGDDDAAQTAQPQTQMAPPQAPQQPQGATSSFASGLRQYGQDAYNRLKGSAQVIGQNIRDAVQHPREFAGYVGGQARDAYGNIKQGLSNIGNRIGSFAQNVRNKFNDWGNQYGAWKEGRAQRAQEYQRLREQRGINYQREAERRAQEAEANKSWVTRGVESIGRGIDSFQNWYRTKAEPGLPEPARYASQLARFVGRGAGHVITGLGRGVNAIANIPQAARDARQHFRDWREDRASAAQYGRNAQTSAYNRLSGRPEPEALPQGNVLEASVPQEPEPEPTPQPQAPYYRGPTPTPAPYSQDEYSNNRNIGGRRFDAQGKAQLRANAVPDTSWKQEVERQQAAEAQDNAYKNRFRDEYDDMDVAGMFRERPQEAAQRVQREMPAAMEREQERINRRDMGIAGRQAGAQARETIGNVGRAVGNTAIKGAKAVGATAVRAAHLPVDAARATGRGVMKAGKATWGFMKGLAGYR